MTAPTCAATAASTGKPCRFKGTYRGYCGHHRRCVVEQCGEPFWWHCRGEAFCRNHAARHAGRCRSCGGHYRRVVTRYQF